MSPESLALEYQFFNPKKVVKIILYDYTKSLKDNSEIQNINFALKMKGLDTIELIDPFEKKIFSKFRKKIKEVKEKGWVIVIYSSAFRQARPFPINLFPKKKNLTPEVLMREFKNDTVMFVRRSRVKGQEGDIQKEHNKYYKISKLPDILTRFLEQQDII